MTYLGSRNLNGSLGYCFLTFSRSSANLVFNQVIIISTDCISPRHHDDGDKIKSNWSMEYSLYKLSYLVSRPLKIWLNISPIVLTT